MCSLVEVENHGQRTEVADAFLQAQEAAAQAGEWALLGQGRQGRLSFFNLVLVLLLFGAGDQLSGERP